MPNPTSILITVLSTYERNGWHHPSITQFLHDLRFGDDRYATNFVPLHCFNPAASARNKAGKIIKENPNVDWLLMIDNDMRVPANLLDTIKDAPADADIITPIYYMWDDGKPQVTLCWGADNVTHQDELVTPGFKELTKCGTGSIFIRRRVFEGMEMPYFWYEYDKDGGMETTEDIPFCVKARRSGFKIYGNPAITVGHYHNVDLSMVARLVFGKKVVDERGKTGKDLHQQEKESPSNEPAVATACPAC